MPRMVEVGGRDETDDAAGRIADELEWRGLGPVARLLVDAHRPLGPLASDVGVALGGLLGVVGGKSVSALRALMEDDSGLDRLLSRLDDARRRRAQPR